MKQLGRIKRGMVLSLLIKAQAALLEGIFWMGI
jgi:hypothetical protein